MWRRKSNRQIVLDARPAFDSGPVALCEVLGRPWIATFLDMVADAGATSRLTVIATPEFGEEIERVVAEHPRSDGVAVVTEMPDHSDGLYASVGQVYVRHLFIRAVRGGSGDFGRAPASILNTPADMKIAEEMIYRDISGIRTGLVHYFYRPLARRLATPVAATGITPNAVTLGSLLIVPAAATLIALDSYSFGLVAAALLQLYFVLDVMDGVLARMTKRRSNFGYWFDTMVDTIHDSAMAVGFTLGAVLSTGNVWLAIPGGVWIVAMAATWSNMLIELAAGTVSQSADQGLAPVRPSIRRRLGLSVAIFFARRIKWALSMPEIILALFTLGLVLNAEAAVVILFSVLHLYSMLRMLQLAYARYRSTELTSSRTD